MEIAITVKNSLSKSPRIPNNIETIKIDKPAAAKGFSIIFPLRSRGVNVAHSFNACDMYVFLQCWQVQNGLPISPRIALPD